MIKIIPSLVFALFLSNACQQPAKIQEHGNYDLSKPVTLTMPSSLNEISGIAFNKGNADTVYAEQDEVGKLFYFPMATLDVKQKKFGKKGDYEDISICNGTVILLRSDGILFSFPLDIKDESEVTNVKESGNLLPGGEYEGMYADELSSQVYVLCKRCDADNESKSVSGHILQMAPQGSFELKSTFQVNAKDIAAKLNEKKLAFRPSALAKNLVDNQWYILSSVNKLLVVTDDKWAVKEVYPLDPSLFDQPEGIAFDKDNNLYISNERSTRANATILKFAFIKKKN
jgi:hypothetical protein